MRDVDICDIYTLQSMVDRRAKEKSLTIEFDPEAHTAYTSEGKIVLPTPRLPMSRDELDLVYGYMIHETGHHTRPRAFKILEGAGITNEHPIFNLFNIVEDGAMEQEVSSAYAGDRKALGKGMRQHVKNQIKNISGFPPEFFKDPDQVKAMAIYSAGLESRMGWDAYANESILLYEQTPPEPSRALFRELVEEGWVKKMSSHMQPDEAWDLSCDLYKRLYPEADEKKVEKIRKQGKEGVEKGKKEKGEGMPGYKKSDKEGDKKKLEGGNVSYSWKDWVPSDHQGEGLPATINWEGRKFEDSYIPLPKSQVEVIACKEQSHGTKGRNDKSAAALANAIRIYIQAKARTKITPERYKGKLDRKAITRLAFPPLDGGEWNKKIFYTMDTKRYKNTCIGILTDWSGSMSGQKKELASEATAKLASVFDQQLRVPTLISAFSSQGHNCTIGVIKDFQAKDSNRAIHAKFDYFDAWTSGNADGDALLWMHEKLQARKEQRKIMIVLSDGAPTDGHQGSSPDDMLRAVAQAIEKRPDFTLIGIGIDSTQVKRYYKNYKVVHKVTELDKELLKILKETYTHDD